MCDTVPPPQSQREVFSRAVANRLAAAQHATEGEQGRQHLIYILMVPTMVMIFNASIFGVALPTVRAEYGIDADIAAWLVTAYSLPFMMLMPLYGRLGDSIGKRNLMILGLLAFMVGTVIGMMAPSLPLLILGRAIQGAGVAGIAPLSMAIISERFPRDERGKALGTWNSIGPLVSTAAPLLAGFMIVSWGWRSLFVPVFLLALAAMTAIWLFIPSLRKVRFGFLRTFDWLGVALLAAAITFLVFFVSSRPITGVDPLRDWRLLLISLASGVLFVLREQRRSDPFLALELFAIPSLRWASLGSALRMFTMSGTGFLLPLYLADVRNLSASAIGAVVMFNAMALLATMRLGGQLADRWGSHWPVSIGMSIQATTMVGFALMPPNAPILWVILTLVAHGLGAGLSLAALHRASMSNVPAAQTGQAAGVYSMIRFGGVLMGSALGGVILQQSQLATNSVVISYRIVFASVAAVALVGACVGLLLREAR